MRAFHLFVVCLVAWLGAVGAAHAQAPARPHIVVLMPDDLGWHDLGFLGREIRTPHIDKLAERALRLNQFYVQPYSTQTRAALLTGRYPMRYGLQTLSVLPQSQFGLPTDERLLSQALKDAGYRTALVGKWQLGHSRPEMLPTKRGFDSFHGTLAGSIDPVRKVGPAGADWYRNDKPLKEDGYVTTLIGREAAQVVAKHDATKPLFLMVSFTAPAAPMFAPREYLERNAAIRDDARRTYAAMVSAVDDAIGQVVGALEKKAMLDDTLIVFFSDNGGAVVHKYPTGDGDVTIGAADNDPYRDGKGSLYEGGLRVPALLHWPKGGLDGGTSNALMHVTDLYPLLLARAGASADQRKPIDGIDPWKTLVGDAIAPRREVLLDIEDTRGALRSGDWKLVVYTTLPVQIELYDVPHDPGEEDNAAERFPERVKELMARLSEYAWDMQPSRYVDELGRARRADLPMVWGRNPPKFGVSATANSRGDPSLTVERADVPAAPKQ